MTYQAPTTTLAEDLLLLCEDPKTGRIRPPKYFHRTLAGAVLAEFAWRGVIVLHGEQITEIHPRSVGEPVADELLGKIVSDVRVGTPGLRQILVTDAEPGFPVPARRGGRIGAARDAMYNAAQANPARDLAQWVTSLSFGQDRPVRRQRAAMVARGLLTARERRVLGVVPRTRWFPATPGHANALHPRVDRALRASAWPPGAPEQRDIHLAVLAETADLTPRLLPGDRHRDTRRRVAELTRTDPIARAVLAAIADDRAADSGPNG